MFIYEAVKKPFFMGCHYQTNVLFSQFRYYLCKL